MIAFCLGIAAAMLQPALLPIYLYPLLTATVACCYYKYYFKDRSKYQHNLLKILVFFVLGLSYSSGFSHWQLSERLPEQLARSDWRITGRIVGLPEHRGELVRFNLAVVNVELLTVQPAALSEVAALDELSATANTMDRLRISWYQPEQKLQSGMLIESDIRLKPPHGLANPAGFDYERWLFVRGIDATGYIRQMHHIEPSTDFAIGRIRHSINQQISELFPQPQQQQQQALIQALVTGNKQGLSQDDWQQLRRSGTVHLAVISGLHIGFMAFLGWWLGRGLSLLLPNACMRVLPYALPYTAALICAGAYALIAGAELPVQRAFIMLAVLMLSGLLLKASNWWNRWLLALTVVLLFSPHAILETGLWLSFGAVAALIWLAQRRWRWREALKLQLMLTLAMLPLYLFFFSGVSITAPFVNLLAIPLITCVVMLIFPVLGLVMFELEILAQPLIWLLTQLIDLFWWLVQQGSAAQWAYVEVNGLTTGQLVFVGIAVVMLLLPATLCPRWVACFCFMPLLLGIYQASERQAEQQGFSAWVFDVGQGLAVLVKVGDYHLLYDTGAAYRSGGSAAERAIVPYLKQAGIKRIDHLVLSHNDIDHTGGYQTIAKTVVIDKMSTSYKLNSEYKANLPYSFCRHGQTWQYRDVQFEMLAGSVGDNDNDRSCVLRISNRHCSLLLPGDIGSEIEARLPRQDKVNWLVAAHHGSKHSTSAQFIQQLQPQAVIFSAGYANAYNHPHPDVIQRVQDFSDAQVLSTASHGAIKLRTDPELGCLYQGFRQAQKRLWR